MKRIAAVALALVMALTMALSMVSCKDRSNEGEGKGGGAKLADGRYSIEVDSSASMFRVVDCTLTVQGETLTADLTMSGQGYGYLFMGKAEQAPKEPTEQNAITFKLNDAGEKVFTIPVSALDTGIDCAAWSIKKEEWYDRVLTFRSETARQQRAYADGSYTCEVTLTGGSGRASIESPAKIEIRNGKAVATIVWSSSHYEYVKLGEVQYDPVNAEGNSTFEIPISFDKDIEVSALTTAMSEPHLVDYVLRFDSATLKQK